MRLQSRTLQLGIWNLSGNALRRLALAVSFTCFFMYLTHQILKDSKMAVKEEVGNLVQLALQAMDSVHTNEHMVVEYFNGTVYDDPKMVAHVRDRKIIPPSKQPYNLSNPDVIDGTQYGQPKVLEKYLHNMTGGFFVEVGAYDGEGLSNSLYFERFFSWSGLLIEANPMLYQSLVNKNRKSHSIHACLSLHPAAEILQFFSDGFGGRISTGQVTGENLQCFPLYTMMLALGITQIDYFSLDIEGDELKVLKTIPWDKMQIRVLEVEVNHIDEGGEAVKQYMESVGYTFLQSHYIDLYFGKKDLLDPVPISNPQK